MRGQGLAVSGEDQARHKEVETCYLNTNSEPVWLPGRGNQWAGNHRRQSRTRMGKHYIQNGTTGQDSTGTQENNQGRQ